MNKRSRVAALVAISICAMVGLSAFAFAQTQSGVRGTLKKEMNRMTHASGEFEVKMTPQPADDKAAVGKFSLDKKFRGDLDATSKGEMLAIMTTVEGSAGYVAMEQVTGTLNGRSGTFALQHSGTMTRGTPQLSVTVVPDSGTGQLLGLSGQMTIKIDGAKHSYEFEYTLPENH
jgi:uncharacterized protein DUF3224